MSVASVVAAWLVLSVPWLVPGASPAERAPAGARLFVGVRLHVGPHLAPIELGAWRCDGSARRQKNTEIDVANVKPSWPPV